MKAALLIVSILSIGLGVSAARTESNSLPGSCGEMGCDEKPPTSSEILGALLGAPEIKKLVGDKDIPLVRKMPGMILTYRIETNSDCYVDARVEFIEIPMPIDGVQPIQIGSRFTIITSDTSSTCK